jgi:LEA14-like dessication related protein
MKTTTTSLFSGVFVLMVAAVTAAACGGPALKPPTLHVASLKFTGAGITGAKLNVAFNVRNVNPTPLAVENFRYELTLNGHHMGSGYYPTRMVLGGMAEQKVVSVFDLNWLSLPGTVQSILQQDHVRARVDGTFFIAGGKTLRFSNDADVSMQK